MALVVPAYTSKLSWADKHLGDLQRAMAEFASRDPYRACRAVRGQHKGQWVLEITEPPDPAWSLMVGDILYNLRAALDYLAGALNPSSERSHVMFPIVSEPIWNLPPADNENQRLTDLRRRWEVSTRKMRPEAVEILKRLQPVPIDAYRNVFHGLDLLNTLSNKDRHRTLHLHVTGVAAPIHILFTYADGRVERVQAEPTPLPGALGTGAIGEGTVITPPSGVDVRDVADIQLRGRVTQAIDMPDGRQAPVPDSLQQILEWVRQTVVVPLTPYLHGLPK